MLEHSLDLAQFWNLDAALLWLSSGFGRCLAIKSVLEAGQFCEIQVHSRFAASSLQAVFSSAYLVLCHITGALYPEYLWENSAESFQPSNPIPPHRLG
ncbi:hypothetical protein BDV11DRAFT_192389 [Aspergillus similis]